MSNLQNYMKKLLLCCIKNSKYWMVLFLFLSLNIMLKMFFVDIFSVSGDSMYPILKNGDYVVLCKFYGGMRLPRNVYEIPWIGSALYYLSDKEAVNNALEESKKKNFLRFAENFASLKSGDLVAFNNPLALNNNVVKRCVGMPGDSICWHIEDNDELRMLSLFSVVPYKGMKISEKAFNYEEKELMNKNRAFRYDEKDSSYVAIDDCYIMLGDNKTFSIDSRHWGVISKDLVIGKVIYVFSRGSNIGKLFN